IESCGFVTRVTAPPFILWQLFSNDSKTRFGSRVCSKLEITDEPRSASNHARPDQRLCRRPARCQGSGLDRGRHGPESGDRGGRGCGTQAKLQYLALLFTTEISSSRIAESDAPGALETVFLS